MIQLRVYEGKRLRDRRIHMSELTGMMNIGKEMAKKLTTVGKFAIENIIVFRRKRKKN